ncbi:MAG: prolyl oligopeptidase family serine peptidase, partial [Planctomycetota bacterium]|nr:prolyl oligopeptidase family serine peptidase [Planctomycetota bacterium]
HEFTIGRAWVGEFGSSADPDMFKVLHAYSPYHNLKDGVRYPATLVTTADRDDRVVPAHSFKYIARLQAAQGGTKPVLIRVETKAGHGAGTTTTKYIELVTDQYAFLTRWLGMKGGR